MRTYPEHEDLGLNPQADRTPDLRPGRGECKHCTVPTEGGDLCAFCKRYVPPADCGTR